MRWSSICCLQRHLSDSLGYL